MISHDLAAHRSCCTSSRARCTRNSQSPCADMTGRPGGARPSEELLRMLGRPHAETAERKDSSGFRERPLPVGLFAPMPQPPYGSRSLYSDSPRSPSSGKGDSTLGSSSVTRSTRRGPQPRTCGARSLHPLRARVSGRVGRRLVPGARAVSGCPRGLESGTRPGSSVREKAEGARAGGGPFPWDPERG